MSIEGEPLCAACHSPPIVRLDDFFPDLDVLQFRGVTAPKEASFTGLLTLKGAPVSVSIACPYTESCVQNCTRCCTGGARPCTYHCTESCTCCYVRFIPRPCCDSRASRCARWLLYRLTPSQHQKLRPSPHGKLQPSLLPLMWPLLHRKLCPSLHRNPHSCCLEICTIAALVAPIFLPLSREAMDILLYVSKDSRQIIVNAV